MAGILPQSVFELWENPYALIFLEPEASPGTTSGFIKRDLAQRQRLKNIKF
jgi:hypothetical protein